LKAIAHKRGVDQSRRETGGRMDAERIRGAIKPPGRSFIN